jgi:hypothetical protein
MAQVAAITLHEAHSRSLVWLALPDRLKRMKARVRKATLISLFSLLFMESLIHMLRCLRMREAKNPDSFGGLVAGYDSLDGPNGEVIRLSQIAIYLAKK